MFKIIGGVIFLWGLLDTGLSYTDGGDLWYQLFGIILTGPFYQYSGIAAMVLGGIIYTIGNKRWYKLNYNLVILIALSFFCF